MMVNFKLKQECIPVGCVHSATVAICCRGCLVLGGACSGGVSGPSGVPVPGGGAALGGAWSWGRGCVVSQHALRQTPPVNRMTDRQV